MDRLISALLSFLYYHVASNSIHPLNKLHPIWWTPTHPNCAADAQSQLRPYGTFCLLRWCNYRPDQTRVLSVCVCLCLCVGERSDKRDSRDAERAGKYESYEERKKWGMWGSVGREGAAECWTNCLLPSCFSVRPLHCSTPCRSWEGAGFSKSPLPPQRRQTISSKASQQEWRQLFSAYVPHLGLW